MVGHAELLFRNKNSVPLLHIMTKRNNWSVLTFPNQLSWNGLLYVALEKLADSDTEIIPYKAVNTLVRLIMAG